MSLWLLGQSDVSKAQGQWTRAGFNTTKGPFSLEVKCPQ